MPTSRSSAHYADGEAMDSVIQEVDVESGDVMWEWRSLDHVALA